MRILIVVSIIALLAIILLFIKHKTKPKEEVQRSNSSETIC